MRIGLPVRARDRASIGQSLVEFSILFPLMLILLVGVVDLGRVYYSYITLTNAARVGARYGAAYPTQINQILSGAVNEAAGSGITLTTASVSCPSGNCTTGKPIQVTVGFNFQLFSSSILGLGTVPLQASEQMEIFSQ